MKPLSIARQLTLLLSALAGVTLVVAALLSGLLQQSLTASQQASDSATRGLGRAYQMTEKLAAQQAIVQTLLRQKDPDEMERLVKEASAGREELTKLIAAAGAEGAAMNDRLATFASSQDAAVNQFLQGNLAGAYEGLLSEVNPKAEALAAEVRLYYQTAERAARAGLAAAAQRARTRSLLVLGLSAFLLVGAVAFGWDLRRRLARHLAQLSAQLSEAASQTMSAAGQVSAASQTLAEGTSEQAASLEETGASLEELASMTKRNAESAQTAKELAREARQAADQGANDMEAMNAAMGSINASSADIAKIIRTIDEIAFQTNILALNAAVEAARAGEAGMGFAVVADEVRNLAQRCAEAARETAGKIEGSITKTQQGVQLSGKVAQGLQVIVAKARQVDDLIAEIAAASSEQNQGITQVNTAVSQMDKVTQSSAATAEETAAAAAELNTQAASLRRSVQALETLVGTTARIQTGRTSSRQPPPPAPPATEDTAPATSNNSRAPAPAELTGRF